MQILSSNHVTMTPVNFSPPPPAHDQESGFVVGCVRSRPRCSRPEEHVKSRAVGQCDFLADRG